MSSGQLKCQQCDQEFTLYKNLIRHVNTVHGNESRKDNEARKDGLLECTDIHTFEETGVGCDPQVAFKSPNSPLHQQSNSRRMTCVMLDKERGLRLEKSVDRVKLTDKRSSVTLTSLTSLGKCYNMFMTDEMTT